MNRGEAKPLAELEMKFAIDAARVHARAIESCLAITSDPEAARRGLEELEQLRARIAWLSTLVALVELRLAVPVGSEVEQRLALAGDRALVHRSPVRSN